MNRIVKLSVNDVVIDAAQAAGVLTSACNSHHQPMRVTGICCLDETLLIPLEELTARDGCNYVFSKLPSLAEDDLVAEINSRYSAGFTTIGTFQIDDKLWGLFALNPEFRKKSKSVNA